jgi:hypothetical protein
MAGTKRKQGDDSIGQMHGSKSHARQSEVQPRLDPTYGQRSALPGLDNESITTGDDLGYGDADAEALNYLRAVR